MANNTTAPLDPKIADRLLDLLGDSDKFRELFQSDTAAALELIGYLEPIGADSFVVAASGPTASIADCLCVNQLASKEAIRAAHNELKSMLLGGLNHTTPQLDANPSADRRTLK
jgi:putative modified peptide